MGLRKDVYVLETLILLQDISRIFHYYVFFSILEARFYWVLNSYASHAVTYQLASEPKCRLFGVTVWRDKQVLLIIVIQVNLYLARTNVKWAVIIDWLALMQITDICLLLFNVYSYSKSSAQSIGCYPMKATITRKNLTLKVKIDLVRSQYNAFFSESLHSINIFLLLSYLFIVVWVYVVWVHSNKFYKRASLNYSRLPTYDKHTCKYRPAFTKQPCQDR